MEVVKITPRGYCHGVVSAIEMARQVAKDPGTPRPIFILGLIVHNRHVVETLRADYGIISLDGPDRRALLQEIPPGATVIFTAHGVSPDIKAAAAERGLTCYDATCPDVTRTHQLVQELASRGYHIIYIGKRGHPEADGVVGEAPRQVHLVESKVDIDKLVLPAAPLAMTAQTTMSQWDNAELTDYIKERYPAVAVYNDICQATLQRQEAAVRAAAGVDAVVVVGDARSNNTKRLVQVVKEQSGKPAYLVDSADEIDPAWFAGCRRVAVTAGSSTPTHLTRDVITYLESLDT